MEKIKASILIVEDQNDVLKIIEKMINRRFETVYSAENGQEALEVMQQFKPDILLTDIKMPLMDGLSLASKIKSIYSDTEIIIMTAYNETSYLHKAIDIGIKNYILKPIDTEKLFKVLHQSAENIQNRKDVIEYKLKMEVNNQILEKKVEHRTNQLLNEKKIAEKALRVKNIFITHMTHELRTPLNAIQGFSELLESEIDGTLNVKQKSHLQNIQSSSNSLLNVINNVLQLTKIDSGKLNLKKSEFSINTFLIDLVEKLKPHYEKKEMKLQSTPLESDFIFTGDKVKLYMTIYNILVTSLSLSREKHSINLKTVIKNNNLVFHIQDQCLPINSIDKDIWYKFSDAEEFLSGEFPGQSIGLMLADRFIKAHNGLFSVKTSANGSSYAITLPVQKNT